MCNKRNFKTKYSNLQKGTEEEDPVSVQPLILVLEVTSAWVSENLNTECLNFFSHIFLSAAYKDGITLFC